MDENAKERLNALLGVMNITQGEDSEYSNDARLGISYICKLESLLSEKEKKIEELIKALTAEATEEKDG